MTGGTRIRAIVAAGQQAAATGEDTSAEPFGESVSGEVSPPSEQIAAEADQDWYVEPTKSPARDWLPPALGLVGMALWTAFFVWANPAVYTGATPQQAVSLASTWAVPVLLICVIWLIALRTSRREAVRFGDAARVLSDESSRLEGRLTVINRELSLAREFLSAESRDLESLGRIASERISQHAAKLQSLVQENGAQVDAIAHVSSSALDNMEKLRGQLPVIASSAKDVTNNIANAGRTAHVHVQEMIEGFVRINEFGQASERQIDALREQVQGSLEQLGGQLGNLHAKADSHFSELDARGAELRDRLDRDEVAALAGIRNRAGALLEELQASRQQLDSHEAESITSLRARLSTLRDEGEALGRKLRDGEAGAVAALETSLARLEEQVVAALRRLEALDSEASLAARQRISLLGEEATAFDSRLAERNRQFSIEMEHRAADAAARHAEDVQRITALIAGLDDDLAERRNAHEAHSVRLANHGVMIAAQIEATGERIAAIAAFGNEAERQLGGNMQLLAEKLAASRDALADTDATVAQLTDDSVRLLELLQSSTQQSREVLPAAIASSEGKLAEIEGRVSELLGTVERAMERGGELADSVTSTRNSIGQSLAEIRLLQVGVEQGAARHGNMLSQLHLTLQDLEKDSNRLTTKGQADLLTTLETLAAATREAVETMEHSGRSAVTAMAEKLSRETAGAIDRVLTERTDEALGRLAQAAAHASDTGREAALHLRDQLARIDELAGNLERRVAQAREKVEDQVDSDFSRRVALITESLNSNSIDIAKALSSEVTDTAWASYLRGDRGVFTRRAVRLLDTAEARSIAQVYDDDGEFREHVSRYIHDFESMLRQLLSTRDGHALSVTLLSSDMGKLYVSLAQAIERLRN